MADPDGGCLVARAVPCALPRAANDDDLTAQLEQLSVNDAKDQEKKKQQRKEINNISPADYVTLQSIRSSALAKKTNTTSKFGRGGAALFADLLNKGEDKEEKKEAKKDVKKEEEKNEEPVGDKKKEDDDEKKTDDKEEDEEKKEKTEEGEEGELLARGPVRSGHAAYGHHPYMYRIPYGTAAQTVEGQRAAKEKLRALISDSDMDSAWAWTCKCMQYAPGALSHQDNDRDTLLHIVTIHTDLAKIYALVEQQLKTNYSRDAKPFDLPNRFHETPLFLAVEKRRAEVVAYLLEAGAHPNSQTLRPERECAIHYAASRGMSDIVKILCSNPETDVNKLNGMGSSALLCAIRNHGAMDEEQRQIIDNKDTIRELMRAGADPMLVDATNGKTVIHYAVERMNAELIELFKEFLNEPQMTELVNQGDLCSETPMMLLQQQRAENPQAQQLRSNLFLTLTICGAEIKRE
ncbi:unnamed protein product, partial [Mesorhabditis spiculigera]